MRFSAVSDFLAANVHGIFAAEFGGDFFQRVLHGLAILWLREIDKRLVNKFAAVEGGRSRCHGQFTSLCEPEL